MENTPDWHKNTATKRWLAGGMLAAVVFIVYLPALNADFVNWDDWIYVYENDMITSLNGDFFKWLFSAVVCGIWHPLTMFSHAVTYAVCGLNPFGHHLVNVVLHSLNTFLVFILTIRIVSLADSNCEGNGLQAASEARRTAAAALTALLFGLHPLHVESVAWVSERKDVLYAFFFLLSVLFYLKYASLSRRPAHYAATLVFFILSLLSKPMAVTLPAVLLILDWYPLKRRDLRQALVEKIPFFVLAGLASIAAVAAQKKDSALASADALPFAERLVSALHGYAFYLYKAVLPFDLAPFYPHPISIPSGYIVAAAGFAALCAVCLIFIRKISITVALCYYIATLLPVIGLIQVGGQSAADRYSYLPLLGPFMLAGGVFGWFIEAKKPAIRVTAILAAVVMCAAAAGVTIVRIDTWHDSISLWTRQISVYPDSKLAFYNRGTAYFHLGKYPEAERDLTRAIELDPEAAASYLNRGNARSAMKNREAALKDYKKAVETDPSHAKAYYNMGIIYEELGDRKTARLYFEKALMFGIPEANKKLR